MNMLIAIIGGIANGALVHYVSRALGCEVTIPGALFACAVTAAGLSRVRWILRAKDQGAQR